MGIQMKQKEPTKTFMMISNWQNLFDLHGLYKKYFSVERVKLLVAVARHSFTC